MKRLLLASMLLASLGLYAQDFSCGTPQIMGLPTGLQGGSAALVSPCSFAVNTQVWIVRAPGDPTTGIDAETNSSFADIVAMVDTELNGGQFGPDISFVLDPEEKYLETPLYTDQAAILALNSQQLLAQLGGIGADCDQLNIYLFGASVATPAGGAAFSNFDGSANSLRVYLGAQAGGMNAFPLIINEPQVLTHEVGHVMGLYHTHANTLAFNASGQREVPECVENLTLYYQDITLDEFGADGSVGGDLVADTRPDYRDLPIDPMTCELDPNAVGPVLFQPSVAGTLTDCDGALGADFDPLVDVNPFVGESKNYMSYHPTNCWAAFTAGQIDRMEAHFSLSPALAAATCPLDPPVVDWTAQPNSTCTAFNLVLEGGDGLVQLDVVGYDNGYAGPFPPSQQPYIINVTSQGCTQQFEYTFVGGDLPSAQVATTPTATCDNTGELSVSSTLGLEPVTWNWDIAGDLVDDATVSDLGEGSYLLYLTDGQGCQNVQSHDVGVLPDPTATWNVYPSLSCIESGTIIITGSTGTAPLTTTLWVNGTGVEGTTFSTLSPGDYTLTVSDGNGCAQSYTITVPVIDISATLNSVTPSIACANTGAIDMNVSAPIEALNPIITWTLPDNTPLVAEDLSGIGPGTYTWVANDLWGCQVGSGSVEITAPDIPEISLVGQESPSACVDNGVIDVTVTPSDLSFSWEDQNGFVSNSEDLSGLPAGTYTLTATDPDGCQATLSVNLVSQLAPEVSLVSAEDASSCNDDGAISISTNYQGLDISWSGPDGFFSNELVLTDLAPGGYQVIVSDANGCSDQLQVQLDQNELPYLIEETIVPPISCLATGEIHVSVGPEIDGIMPSVVWIANGFGDSGVDLTGLEAGQYFWLVTDLDDCFVAGAINLESDPALPAVSVVQITPATICDADGAIEIETIPSGLPVSWSGPDGFTDAGTTISGLSSGIYYPEVTDEFGCESASLIQVPLGTGYCLGDFNGDCLVDSSDLLYFLGQFNQPDADPAADFNGDGAVNTLDQLDFLQYYNQSCYD